MNTIIFKDRKLKVKKWGYFLNGLKKDPFLNSLDRLTKRRFPQFLPVKMIQSHFGFFARKTRAPDIVFWPVVDRWLLCTIFNVYFKTRVLKYPTPEGSCEPKF
jgi:hypothetical protein